jgi:hypothetical protein
MKRPHPAECHCPVHDLEPRGCPKIVNGERCDKVCRGARALGSHIAWIHKKRKRKMQAVLVPSGMGYLQKLLRDPRSASRLDVSALPRFAQMLAQGQRSRKALRRNARAMLLEAREHPHDAFRNTLRMPGTVAEPIAHLALLGDVPVTVVTSALLSYGLEMLANEVRKYKAVPAPHLPTPPLVAEGSAARDAFKMPPTGSPKRQVLPSSDGW